MLIVFFRAHGLFKLCAFKPQTLMFLCMYKPELKRILPWKLVGLFYVKHLTLIKICKIQELIRIDAQLTNGNCASSLRVFVKPPVGQVGSGLHCSVVTGMTKGMGKLFPSHPKSIFRLPTSSCLPGYSSTILDLCLKCIPPLTKLTVRLLLPGIAESIPSSTQRL